jgi:hypothetical protein
MYLSNNFDKKKRKWLLLMQVSTAVLLFSDAFLYCYFDADNFYHRNTGFVISLLFPVVSMLIDLSLLVQFRKNIRKKIFVSMLSYIYNVKELSSDLDMDVAIQNLLGVINAYFRVDRTYIFEISADGKTLKNTYEYVSDGVSAQIENLQEVPIDVISVWIDHFQKDEVYFMSTVEQEKGSESYEMLQEQDVISSAE